VITEKRVVKRIEIHKNNGHEEVRIYDVDKSPEKQRIRKKLHNS